MKKEITAEEVARVIDFESIDNGVRFYLYLDEDGNPAEGVTADCITEDMMLDEEYESPSAFADAVMTLENDAFRGICEWLAYKAQNR